MSGIRPVRLRSLPLRSALPSRLVNVPAVPHLARPISVRMGGSLFVARDQDLDKVQVIMKDGSVSRLAHK